MEPKETIATLHGLFTDKLLVIRTKFPKTIVFKTVAECAALYKDKRRDLGKDFTEPPGYQEVSYGRNVYQAYIRVYEENFELVSGSNSTESRRHALFKIFCFTRRMNQC